jgi:antitoxin (DNA-binding transcriptional repressor) of toxin-antitoxin stability system
MARYVTISYARTRLAALVVEMEGGTEIIITRWGKPVAKLVRVAGPPKRQPGDCDWPPGTFDPEVFRPMTEEEMHEEGWP